MSNNSPSMDNISDLIDFSYVPAGQTWIKTYPEVFLYIYFY